MPRENEPELALVNGVIMRVEPDETAEAVAVSNGRISAVGTDAEIRGLTGSKTKTVDLKGRTVLPGFVESHCHPFIAGSAIVSYVDCSTPPNNSIDDVVKRLSAKAEETEKGKWIRGMGYDDTGISDNRHLTRQDLDRASTEHPITISHISGHLNYANSLALKTVGISKSTPDPEGGKIARDDNGEPTGVLLEQGVLQLMLPHLPKETADDVRRGLKAAAEALLRVGVTSFHDASFGVSFGNLSWKAYIDAYEEAMKSGAFPIRVYGLAMAAPAALEPGGYRPTISPERMRVNAIKIISDGSIQGYTGLLSQPYHDKPDTMGIATTAESKVYELVTAARKQGMQVATHANGDAAIESVLNVYERVLKEHPKEEHRFRLEHCQMTRVYQLYRMAKLGVCASFFNTHVYYWGDRHRDRFIGEERASRISPLASALKKGIKFGLHSDWFVSPVNPIRNIATAVNRLTSSGKLLGPEQRIGVKEAIRAMTIDAAYLGFEEKIKGSIEVGKLGDFVVLSDNPLTVDPAKIADISVEMTIIGGKVEYEALRKGSAAK